jgi:hypothetical protein
MNACHVRRVASRAPRKITTRTWLTVTNGDHVHPAYKIHKSKLIAARICWSDFQATPSRVITITCGYWLLYEAP